MTKEFVLPDIFNWVQSQGESELTSFIRPFNYAVVNEKLIEIKTFLQENNFEKYKSKVVYSILVESLENVIKHGEYRGFAAAFMMYFRGNEFFLTIANPVSTESAHNFMDRFNALKKLDIEEIKEARLKQLKEGTVSEKGGAGLGLMEMLIKTNKNVFCETRTIGTDVEMLIINMTI